MLNRLSQSTLSSHMKKVIISICCIFASSAFADTTIIQEANVIIKDDPSTPGKEGNLNVRGTATLGNISILPDGSIVSVDRINGPGANCAIEIGNNNSEVNGPMLVIGAYNPIGDGGEAGPQYGSAVIGTWSKGVAPVSFQAGVGNLTTAMFTFAAGYHNDVAAQNSQAIGYGNTISAETAQAIGYKLIANCSYAVFLGANNDPTAKISAGGGWNEKDPVLVVGNGQTTPEKKSNALIIRKNGNAEIYGNVQISKDADIDGKLSAESVVVRSPAGGISMGEFGPDEE